MTDPQVASANPGGQDLQFIYEFKKISGAGMIQVKE